MNYLGIEQGMDPGTYPAVPIEKRHRMVAPQYTEDDLIIAKLYAEAWNLRYPSMPRMSAKRWLYVAEPEPRKFTGAPKYPLMKLRMNRNNATVMDLLVILDDGSYYTRTVETKKREVPLAKKYVLNKEKKNLFQLEDFFINF